MKLVPLNVDDMRPEWVNTLKRIPGDGLKGKYAPRNVLGMLMHNPDTLGEFLNYWVTSKQKMGLTVREQELVILRMAYHYQCNYVWKHHVPVGFEFGINKMELDFLRQERISKKFSRRDRAILELTDEMVIRKNVSDSCWNHHKGQLSDSELIDLISLISQYVLFALTNNVLRVQVESSLDEFEDLAG